MAAHFCTGNPCRICCPWAYWSPFNWPTLYYNTYYTEEKADETRTAKLEKLLDEVDNFLQASIFLVGAEKLKRLVKELKNE